MKSIAVRGARDILIPALGLLLISSVLFSNDGEQRCNGTILKHHHAQSNQGHLFPLADKAFYALTC